MTAGQVGEHHVVTVRAHASRLTLPALGVLVVAVLAGLGFGWTSGRTGWLTALVLAPLLLLAVRGCLVPFARWWTTTVSLTTRRLSFRHGVLSRHGRDLPLHRVVDVSLDRSVVQRLVGSGTLTVRTAGDDEPLVLRGMPQPERLHAALVGLLPGQDGDVEEEW